MRPVRVVAREPLEQVTSLKVKLGLLVAVSVLVATVLATLGAGAVPAGLSIPVTVLLALGVTQLLAVGMTSPLRQMTEAARRMAAGDYDVRVQASSSDEVGELARAFNRMAEDLATVDRQRRELVASVSHELRTPLTALVAVLENLADGVTEPDHETIRVALGQAERLSALVTDLLDLSRVDAGVVPLERGAVDVGSLVGEAVTEAGNGPRHVTFDVQVEPGLTAYADPARLHQLLANLLDNAARHSPAGTSVQVLARRVGDTVRLEVADQGPGIEAEDRERVFERFGTLRDVTGDAAGGGTGLGLAIARWVTDLHGGRITLVDPEAAETGARFRVDLPDPHPSDPTPTPSTTRKETSMTTPATAPTATARPPQRVPVPSIVDDIFGSYWQDRGVPGRPAVLLGCLGLGIFAGVTLPFERPGLAATLVLVAAGVLVLTLSRHRRTPFTWACAALALAFALLVTLRDAEWVIVLGLLTGALLTTTALTAGRTTAQMLLGAMAWPLSGLRGMPWLGRTTRALGSGTQTAAVIRTAVISLVAVLVFGLLFSTADAVFGEWVDAVVPDVSEDLVLRIFIAVAVAGTVLAAAYLALNPPAFGASDAELRRPSQHRFEWLAPVLLIDAVFVLFIAAQAAAFFGGEDYIRSVTGLTYADYVHQGFAQMTVATAADPARGVGRGPQGPPRPRRRPMVAAGLGRRAVRADARRGRLGRAPDGPLPGRLRVHPAAAAGRRVRGVARAAGRRRPRGGRQPARPVAAARRAPLRCRARCSAWPRSTPTPGSPGTTSSATRRPARSTGPTSRASAPTPPPPSRPCRRTRPRVRCTTRPGTGTAGPAGTSPGPVPTTR